MLSFVRVAGKLPGDRAEQAEANDEAESGGEEDGPGVSRETAAKGRHGGISLDSAVHTKERVGYGCLIFKSRGVRVGLATTTASGHEVQGRGLAEDRHVGI